MPSVSGWSPLSRFALLGLSVVACLSCERLRSNGESKELRRSSVAKGCAPDRDEWRPSPGALVEAFGSRDDLSPTAGLALTQAHVFAFDGGAPSIVSLSRRSGLVERTFGRRGEGPGELRSVFTGFVLPPAATADWLDTIGDSIVVFDGLRLQLLTSEGMYIREWFPIRQLPTSGDATRSSRIRVHGSAVLMDMERVGSSPRGVPRKYALLRFPVSGGVDTIATMSLPDIPVQERGGVYSGPREAAPLWDLIGDCYVFSDGHSAHLVVGQLEGAVADTISISLPKRAPPSENSAEIGRLARDPASKRPEPTKIKYVRRLVTSPDGWVWIEPVQPSGLSGTEVIRVNPSLGIQRTDTVPFFPSVFTDPGEFLSVARLGAGVYALRRIALNRTGRLDGVDKVK